MIKFIIGLIIGAFIGIGLMCLYQVSKEDEQ